MKIITRLGAMALALSMLAGCAGGGSSSSAPSSASSSAAGSGTEQLPPMDLSQVSDPCLAVSGLAGETVVAQVGGEDITADLLLYWLSYGIELYLGQMGGYFTELPWDTDMGDGTTLASQIKDSALEAAAFYALLPTLGRNEGLTPSPDAAAAAEEQVGQLTQQLGDETRTEHYLWHQMLTRALFIRLNEAADLHMQIQEL